MNMFDASEKIQELELLLSQMEDELKKCYSEIADKEAVIASMVDVGRVYTKDEIIEFFDNESCYTSDIGQAVNKDDLENMLR